MCFKWAIQFLFLMCRPSRHEDHLGVKLMKVERNPMIGSIICCSENSCCLVIHCPGIYWSCGVCWLFVAVIRVGKPGSVDLFGCTETL